MYITRSLRIDQPCSSPRFLFMSGQLDSTYGAWLIALFLGSLLYGMGILQTYIYLFHRPADKPSDKWTVLVVLCALSFPRATPA
ncbi:hypothetical protein MVEN_00057500 [Mycena venus]|uniref:Uncharacterized protein n=1 Tax=Mycena venus TaxID=2733690 RepID=A0A8H7DE00_9AGAR|nr:hypothetical protein MVEN_00057500 [Mycena venus]